MAEKIFEPETQLNYPMLRRFQFSLRAMPKERLGARLVLAGILFAVSGLIISALIQGWLESLTIHRWMNVWLTYGILSLLAFWGGIAVGAVLIPAGFWLIWKR